VEQLRALIRNHIVHEDAELASVAAASFQRSDLLLLKLLSSVKGTPLGQR
jgi:hypothetical protein